MGFIWGLIMHKIFLSILLVSIVVMGCSFNQFSKPSNLMFQNKTETMSQTLLVKRDEVICSNETASQQICPVDLYIDNFNVGRFYAGNSAQFFLQDRAHNIKLKNCNNGSCKTCEIETNDELSHKGLVISLDDNEFPYFKSDDGKLRCS